MSMLHYRFLVLMLYCCPSLTISGIYYTFSIFLLSVAPFWASHDFRLAVVWCNRSLRTEGTCKHMSILMH